MSCFKAAALGPSQVSERLPPGGGAQRMGWEAARTEAEGHLRGTWLSGETAPQGYLLCDPNAPAPGRGALWGWRDQGPRA